MKAKLIISAVAVISASALLFTGCGRQGMKIPATVAETDTAAFADTSTAEQASQAKRLLEKSGEIAAEKTEETEITSIDELSAALSESGKVTLTTETTKKIKLEDTADDKTLVLSVAGGGNIEFLGALRTLELKECSYIKVEGTAENLIIGAEDAQVEISGTVGNVFVNGKNSVVMFTSVPAENILVTNTSATVINSTGAELVLCLSNGVRYSVGAGQTFNAADLTVATHK